MEEATLFTEPIDRALPKRFWKYRVWNSFARDLIVDGALYFSTVKELNDPFEFRWRERLPTAIKEQREFIAEFCEVVTPGQDRSTRKRQIEMWLHDFRRRMEGYVDGVGLSPPQFAEGVLCLTEVCDDILMWSHYAASHTGVCVGIRASSIARKRICPVHYSERIPLMEGSFNHHGQNETFVRLSLTKAKHWEYEREWRTVDHPGVEKVAGCVDQVIVGLNASESTVKEVRAAVANAPQSVELLKAELKNDTYGFNILPLN